MSFFMSEQEFKKKFEKYSQMIFNIAFSYLKNTYSAEDIVQDTFMKYLKNSEKLKTNEEYEKYWLIRVAINNAKDVLRKNSRITIMDDENINLIPTKNESSRNDFVNCLVCLLKEKYKIIITLFYYENMSIDNIANVLKISNSAVKMRLKRAREQLKELEEKYDYR